MYAIIATGGKQYKVEENEVFDIERLPHEVGATVTFDSILAVGEGAELKVGSPYVENASVEAEVVDHFRGKKVIAFKMKRRKGYRRKRGHRQELTKVKISAICADTKTQGATPAKVEQESQPSPAVEGAGEKE